MRGPDDPGEAKMPATEAKPPDPGNLTRRGGEEHEQRTLQEDNTGELDDQAVQSITESENGDDDEHMPLASQDSIVAETSDSQEEVPVEDTGENQGKKTDKFDLRSASQTKEAPDRGDSPTEKMMNEAAEGQHQEKQPDVQPEEMFAAVVGVMQAEQFSKPRDEWMVTIAELFAIAHDKVAIDEERVPAVKHRYPKLRGDERALLTTFFTEAFVVSRGTFADWDRYATAATRDLYNTSWSLKKILESLIGKVKWAREQPMNMWAAKIKAATTNEITRNGTVKKYQTFMFNPTKFSRVDIETLMRICEQPVAATHGRALREGTKDEWRILAGMAEGSIVCRRVPEFVKSVLDSKEITRLNRTIQMQVEGELVLQLRGRGTISPSRRSTRAIKDDIMLAAVAAGVNLDEVQGMLNMTKTISYNYVQRSVHFFYFDRVTARKYQLMYLPFQKQIYALANVHGPDAGTVWDRQLARDGTRPAMIREYEVNIHNITRFTDIGRLTAYLEKHISTGFDLEDMDTCTPDSRTSTVWRLTMKSMECPEFLRGIARIVWFGRTLILQHPAVGQRLQCLRCGNIGHPMARCRYTDQQLAGPGSRVAVDREVAKLEDLAKPFTSFADMQVTAQKRLMIQAAAARKADVAVLPDQQQGTSQLVDGHLRQATEKGASTRNHASAQSEQQISPEPKRPWVALLKRNGTKTHAHVDTLRQRFSMEPSRYAELDDDNEAEEEQKEKSDDKPPVSETIEISSGEERETERPSRITEEEKTRLHLVTAKPQQLTPTPQLVALKQRERTALAKEITQLKQFRGRLVSQTNQPLEEVMTTKDLESRLGLRPVVTPASGNCMAMALAQAVTDLDLAALPGKLENITAIIKRGVGWSGQLNFLDQFNHFTRKTTLINVERGWEEMDAHESSKQFRWYLHEYATSSSDPEVFVPRYNWGSSEVMALAASFLQRKIFVVAYDVDHKKQWQCCMYKPGSGSKWRKVFEKGIQVPLLLGRWMVEVQTEKAAGKDMPLVVRYWGEHYSAYVHTLMHEIAPLTSQERENNTTREVNMNAEGTDNQSKPNTDGAMEESQQVRSQEPWDHGSWDGNIDELRKRLMGLTIPHELQREIHLILEQAEPQRYAKLLAFLVNTASQLSQPQREQILVMDLQDDSSAEVKVILQRYQISLEVLRQWQQEVARMEAEEKEQTQQQDVVVASHTESDYEPSQNSSPSDSQVTVSDFTGRQRSHQINQQDQPKRSHTLTPIEGEMIRRVMRSQSGAVQVVKATSAPSEMADDRSQGMRLEDRTRWPELWRKLNPIWPLTAKTAFPLANSAMEVWVNTAQKEPIWLLRIVQRFTYPEELLMKLSVKVFEAWTAVWRTECLYGRLVALRSASLDLPTRKWLDGWKAKFTRQPQGNLPPLIDNSDDWQRMRTRNYGEDEILELCDVGNKYQFAQHTICALLYEKELKALTGLEQECENGAQTRLARHLLALKTVAEYSEAYRKLPHTVDWRAVAAYFNTAFEQGEQGRTNHTEGRQ